MNKNLLLFISFVGLLIVPSSAFGAVQAYFDGESEGFIYIAITLDSPLDIQSKDGQSMCHNATECPKWTAMLWDGVNPETISYAGAVYSTLDGLSAGMTIPVSPNSTYNVLQIIGMDSEDKTIATGDIDATSFLPPQFIKENLLDAEVLLDTPVNEILSIEEGEPAGEGDLLAEDIVAPETTPPVVPADHIPGEVSEIIPTETDTSLPPVADIIETVIPPVWEPTSEVPVIVEEPIPTVDIVPAAEVEEISPIPETIPTISETIMSPAPTE